MDGVALGLALALSAAVTTAIAHALLKAGSDRLATRFLIGVTEAVVALPVVLLIPLPDADLWPWLIASAALHVIYQLVLVRAYNATDFSLAFPLARGIVPVATAVLGLILLGDRLSPIELSGVAAVTAGLLLIALHKNLRSGGLIAAFSAGVLTTFYTLVDAHAVRQAEAPIIFIAWFFLLDGLVLAPIVIALRGRRLVPAIAADWPKGILAGIVSLVGFGAALWALALAPAGAVSALRETSVAFAVLIGAVFLKERVNLHHAVGAGIIVIGAAAILLAN